MLVPLSPVVYHCETSFLNFLAHNFEVFTRKLTEKNVKLSCEFEYNRRPGENSCLGIKTISNKYVSVLEISRTPVVAVSA